MPGPLIADRWRRPVAAIALVGLAAVLALAAVVYHGRSTAFDDWVFRTFYHHIGNTTARVLLDISAPMISIVVLLVVVLVAARFRRWDVAALALVGPLAAVFLTEFVLKPIVGRALHPAAINDSLPLSIRSVYPSGHEGTVASTAFVLIIVAAQLPWGRRSRRAVQAACVVWVLAAAVGLIRNFWHYPTDVIGAICLSAACVGGTALFIDRRGTATVRLAKRAWGSSERVPVRDGDARPASAADR
jgi:undecaprenyl-diphosphatase